MVTLYSTQGCHLCEQALQICTELGISPEVVDIAFDETLFKQYGWVIPVVKVASNELNWPFDAQKLSQWLTIHGITHHS
jgi:glutaredoxin